MKKLLILMSIVTITISLLVIQLRNNERIQSEESFEEKSEPLETNKSIDNLSSISSYKDFTIEDYIIDIPDKYFAGIVPEDRMEFITVLDIDNYYSSLHPRTLDGSVTITVFIEPNGDHLIAADVKGCGPLCEQTVWFLKKEGEEYVDVTDDYFPDLDYKKIVTDLEYPNPLIVLPQYGTTIKVADQLSGEIFYEIVWKGGEFIVQ